MSDQPANPNPAIEPVHVKVPEKPNQVKDFTQVMLSFTHLAHWLKGGGFYMNFGPVEANMVFRRKDLAGKSDEELLEAVRSELARLRAEAPPAPGQVPEVPEALTRRIPQIQAGEVPEVP